MIRSARNPATAPLRRLLVLMAAWALLVAGLPARGGRPTEERFPCESCGCGCTTAAECWTNCCCHGPRERAAWALANGSVIPAWDREAREAAATLSASLAPGFERLPACCKAKALGAPSGTKDPDTCKQRGKTLAAAAALMCLPPPAPAMPRPTVIARLVVPQWSVPARAAREPPAPPPRA